MQRKVDHLSVAPGIFMRPIALFLLSFLVVGCSPGERIGEVLIRTDAAGKMATVSMRKSTGNPKADARVMLYARTTFPSRVPHAKPNHTYIHAVVGDPKTSSGDVRVWGPLGLR
jgi:hypothetical protein